MFWGIYYSLVLLLRPFARLGLRAFSKTTDTKRARVLIHRNGQILLVRDIFSKDTWSMPGGGVNKGEEPIKAASREVLEEVGVYITPDEMNFLGELARYSAQDQTYTAVLYSREAESELKLKVQKWEIVEAKWFDIEALPPKRTSSVDRALGLLREA